DARYDVVYEQVSIKQVKPFELYLGRGTALLDAMGRTINETHARLSSLPEAERPGLVAFVVVSDGEENASKEFTKGEIRRTVSRQRNDHGWRFTFLGSNQDVAQTSADMGFDPRSSAPWLMERVGEAYMAAADKVARLRRQMQSRQPLDDSFTDDERRRMT
ncbi:MAG TPA: hypothetical protein VGE52_09495, partial [Pirellulales bacterium]